MFKILVVEDDLWYNEFLKNYLEMNPDYEVSSCSSAKEMKSKLSNQFSVICLDYNLPDQNGGELLKFIETNYPNLPVIIISGQEDIETAVELLKFESVWDYIVKGDKTNELLWMSIIKLRDRKKLESKVFELEDKLIDKFSFEKAIKGNSDELKQVFSIMQKASSSIINVSITGETGTGKELVASAIHYNSNRKKKPFVAVNMSAIPQDLAESELFGHEKGAFTGAVGARKGKFEEANNGTIFLDEIADIPANLQAKLLRVLQEREVTRVGGNKVVKLDVRIIVATHKNLAEEVKSGRFREDLYYRIVGLPINLPALRNRKDDILILAKHFIDGFSKANKMGKVSLNEDAKKKLLTHHYPGNIRELKSTIELAAVMCEEGEIQPQDITFNSPISVGSMLDEEKTLKDYTNQIIAMYMEKYNKDVGLVAKKLDIGKSTLYKLIQKEKDLFSN